MSLQLHGIERARDGISSNPSVWQKREPSLRKVGGLSKVSRDSTSVMKQCWGPVRGGVCLIAPPPPREQTEQLLDEYRGEHCRLTVWGWWTACFFFEVEQWPCPWGVVFPSQVSYERVKGWWAFYWCLLRRGQWHDCGTESWTLTCHLVGDCMLGHSKAPHWRVLAHSLRTEH